MIGKPETVSFLAIDATTNARVSNDQANFTLKVIVGGESGGAESALTAPVTARSNGRYQVTVPAEQNTGLLMTVDGVSSTPNVFIVPVSWENDPAPDATSPIVIPPTGGVATFKDKVRRRLGGGDDTGDYSDRGVEVELTDADYATILGDTLDLLNRHRPRTNRALLNGAVATVSRYPVSQPGLIDVIDVQFVENIFVNQVVDPFDPILNGVMGVQYYDAGGVNDLLRYRMAYTDARIVFSSAPDWHVEKEVASDGTETVVIYLFIPEGLTYNVGYEYTWGYTPDDDPQTGVARVESTMRDWLYDYGTAMAKEIVGRKRSKFGGVTNAEDGTSETDGAALLAEGKKERADLELKLMQRRRSIPPHVG